MEPYLILVITKDNFYIIQIRNFIVIEKKHFSHSRIFFAVMYY